MPLAPSIDRPPRRTSSRSASAPSSSSPPVPKLPLTPWFPGGLEPVREGVYRRRSGKAPFACWSGTHWYADAATPEAAAVSRQVSPQQALPWRGVATPPPGPCFACRGHTVIDQGWDADTGLDHIEECADC